MRKVFLLLFLLAFSSLAYCQKIRDFGLLKFANEDVLFSVRLTNGKIVVLCSEKHNKYLVYRFGTKDKVELQYPAVLNAASWKSFRYKGYFRGGGANSAEEDHSVLFVNNNITYKLYDGWADGYGADAGILITINNKETDLKGIVSTKTGSVGLLRDKGKYIPNHYWDDD